MDSEVERFARGLEVFYRAFGFGRIDVRLSTRPPSRVGDDALWARAESLLGRAASRAGLSWSEQPGGGAFYGPKLEFNLHDAWGRLWQCGTIQLDLILPGRFGVHYAAGDGGRQVPMMLHRALYGSLERFMGMLLEQCAGKLPAWLAPEQVRVLPVAEAHVASAAVVLSELRAADIRADVDTSSETLALRVFRAHGDGVPFVLILGNRELACDSVAIRERGGEHRMLPRSEAIAYFRRSCAPLL